MRERGEREGEREMRGQKLIPPQVTSDRFFWRWQALFYRTGTYWNNSLYALYRSTFFPLFFLSFSFRSLFCLFFHFSLTV